MMSKNALGSRMKEYENDFRTRLPRRQTTILRVDGKAFHTYTKTCDEPFDLKLIDGMNECAIELCKEVQGAQMAYVQSDEISILIHYHKRFDSQAWFDRGIQKIVSVAASIVAATMTEQSVAIFGEIRKAAFDARVFILPDAEVANYFIWRQKDWTRNSVQMLARSHYSHKQLENANISELQEMIFLKGENWNDLPTHLKRGRCVVKEACMSESRDVTRARWVVDNEIPIFVQDRDYVERYLVLEEG
jgi:tRNA(His) 5'-end guanylyltransferase